MTGKMELFCEHYAKVLNASEAARLAGYATSRTGEHGYQLLQKAPIQKRIAELTAKVAKKIHISTDMLIEELWNIASFDIGEIFNDDGSLKPIGEIPKKIRKAISGIDTYKDFTEGVEIGETKKIKSWDKLKAIELIGRYKGIWIDKVQKTNVNLNVDLDEESETFQKIKASMLGDTQDMIDVTPILLEANEDESQ